MSGVGVGWEAEAGAGEADELCSGKRFGCIRSNGVLDGGVDAEVAQHGDEVLDVRPVRSREVVEVPPEIVQFDLWMVGCHFHDDGGGGVVGERAVRNSSMSTTL